MNISEKEKAKELLLKFMDEVYSPNNLEHVLAKACAILCVNQIIDFHKEYTGDEISDWIIYWNEVKLHLEIL